MKLSYAQAVWLLTGVSQFADMHMEEGCVVLQVRVYVLGESVSGIS